MKPIIAGAMGHLLLWTAGLALTCAASAEGVSVDAAMRRALERAPALRAHADAGRAFAADAEAAGALPDLKLRLGLDNQPIEGADALSVRRDFMTMRRVGVSREMVRDEKRELRAARARVDAEREEHAALERRRAIRREVAQAYVEAVYAARALESVAAITGDVEVQVAALVGRVRAGQARPMDAVAAQVQARALEDRRAEIEMRHARARAVLARWSGLAANQSLAGLTLERAAADARALTGVPVEEHPRLAVAASAERAAENELAQARAASRGDWSWEVAYQSRGPAFTDMVSFGIAIDLPQWNAARIDPVVRARESARAAAQAARAEALRAHALERELAELEWDRTFRRQAAFDATLSPLARERAAQALAAWRGGAGSLAEVLEARRQVLETALAHLDLQAAAARAWAQLVYFMPEEQLP
ncbi:MAG: TolC family protein [Burkholderiales bacterium]|nr:TolC family protein [Burkholderiales bacterium]